MTVGTAIRRLKSQSSPYRTVARGGNGANATGSLENAEFLSLVFY
ncbi:hypothetical protein ACFP1C_08450 [Levilactobacillus fujinensis]|uniref:Uncharacterized protein n=1 Tax=Levilactobacillus fujinensis TaxID=2486024 RepID=A0ABW1TGK8_9LACO